MVSNKGGGEGSFVGGSFGMEVGLEKKDFRRNGSRGVVIFHLGSILYGVSLC